MKKLYIFLFFISLLVQSCITKNDPSQVEDLSMLQLWEYGYEHVDAPNHPPLITSNDMIVMTGDAHITALSVDDGRLIWQKEDFGTSSLAGAKLLENEGQLLTNHFAELIAWDSNTGDRLWTVSVDSPLTVFEIGTHASFTGGYAIVGMGSELYTVDTNGDVGYIKNLGMPVGNVAYYRQILFAGQTKTIHGALTLGRITALEAQTGDSLWAYDTPNCGFSWTAPIIENGILYAATLGNSPLCEAIALDAETGEVIWRHESEYIFARNAALGLRHYYVNTGGSLAALDKQTGTLEWRFEWTSSAGLITPVYLEGYVYHSDHRRVFVLDAKTGKLVHEEPALEGGGYIWHLAVSEDKLFVQSSYKLVAYQPWHLRKQ